jgi:hypothetical protein
MVIGTGNGNESVIYSFFNTLFLNTPKNEVVLFVCYCVYLYLLLFVTGIVKDNQKRPFLFRGEYI